jgi:hypothetical protein
VARLVTAEHRPVAVGCRLEEKALAHEDVVVMVDRCAAGGNSS